MRLESIVLHGFKSFAEKTTVRILPGITGIVGPNGCGKSNISEAIRWALGEQSAKSLRGTRMEDLIFHGSASRKPVGLAEVELTFSNDGALAVPWSEVSVSRRLYRTAESEYLLNGNACRLRDILDLLAGTGASPRAYSVMDQEKLNHVLTAKPYERRIFIEEAAGIARYKQQRAETQGKLDATRQNLLRVRDVMDEVKRQVGSLERQAKKAQQYKALHQERQALDLAMMAADYAGLTAAHEALEQEMGRLRREEETQRVTIAQIESREATLRATIQESDYRLADLRQSAQKFQGELERLLERREQAGAQLSLLTGEREQVDQELQGQEGLRAQAQEALALLRVSLAAKESALESLLRLEREREGYGSGVRSLFSGHGAAAVAGVIGTVADLLDVPAGLEAAVEAVLGDRLQWVIVDRFEQGRAALSYLEREGAGAATLLALETLRGSMAPPPLDDDPEIMWAYRLVGGPRPEC